MSPTELLDHIGREEVRITEVRVTALSYKPNDGSYIHICGPVVLTKMDAALVEVFTDQGIMGIGPALGGLEADYAHLVGENAFDVDRLQLPAGVDVACWDVIGRVKGKPVYELLSSDEREADPAVRVYASGGVMWTYYDRGDGEPFGVEELIAEALEYKDLGFDTFKWRPGTDWEEAGISPMKMGEICRQLRDAVGPDFDLGLEKKGYDSWTWEECKEIAPIIDETENWRIAQKAAQHGVKMVTHNWTTSLGTMCNAHLIASTAAGHMCEFFMYPNEMRYGLMKEPMRPVDGVLTLSRVPGFGMAVIDEPETVFPYVDGPNTLPNPRYPHARERAQARERSVAARYQGG